MSDDQKNAELLIRNYTTAFKQISNYYQQYQLLPPRTDSNLTSPVPEAGSVQSTAPTRRPRPGIKPHITTNRIKPSKSHIFSIRTTTVLVLLIGSFFYLTFLENHHELQQPQQSASDDNSTRQADHGELSRQTMIPADAKPDRAIKEIIYFTEGSTIGEVIMAQGEPTEIKNSYWYYGKSYIVFTKGTVSEWYRHPDFPLNIRVNDKPSTRYALPAITNTDKQADNNLKPYWQRQ